MNLSNAIDLYFGGPGSGCNPEVAENGCGRKRSSARVSTELRDTLQEFGGFTYNPRKNVYPDKGYALSIRKAYEKPIQAEKVTPAVIADYMKEHADVFRNDKRTSVGAWYNPKNGKVYLDISIVVPEKAEAVRLAKEHHQLAIFDLESKKTITMKKKIRASKDSNKMIRIQFKPAATPQEIAEEIQRVHSQHGQKGDKK